MPSITVLIVNYNSTEILDCLAALERSGLPEEVIVVDNASTDGSPARIQQAYPWVKLILSPTNGGYTAGNNIAASHATGTILFILNPDAFVTPGWQAQLAKELEAPDVAAVQPKIYRGRPGPQKLLDSAGCDMEFPLGEGPPRGYLRQDSDTYSSPADVAYVSGAAFAIRRAVYNELGGFDEKLWCYYEEADLCWRARFMGYRCRYIPSCVVFHIGSATLGGASPQKLYLQTRNRIIVNLRNLALLNAIRFGATELLHGLLVIAASAVIVKYRQYAVAYIRAWRDACKMTPHILRSRAHWQKQRRLPDRIVLKIHRHVGLIATIARYIRMVLQGKPALFGP